MKIFQIITRSGLGGAPAIVAYLSNALSSDHEVVVFAGEGDGKLFQLLDKRIKFFKVNSLVQNVSPLNDVITLFFFFILNLRYKPDIVHLHSSKAGVLGRLAFPKHKIVYTVHGFDSVRLAYRQFLPLERYLQKKCKAIIAVSRYDKDNLAAEHITRNVCYIYNGIPVPIEQKPEPGETVSIPPQYTKKILCIARICRQKKFDLFLDIAKLLPEYAFIWIGNKEEVQNLPPNVFLLGNIINAGYYNQIVDLFILPSNYEGLPVAIIEAMSFGKPVVASAVGGIPELVKDGATGFISKNTAPDFAEKIQMVINNNSLYKTFSAHSRNFFLENFTVEKMVSEYVKVYRL